MATIITQNQIGYKMKSSVSDEFYNDGKTMTETQVRKALINDVLWDMVYKVIKINETFPENYMINEKRINQNEKSDKYLKMILSLTDKEQLEMVNKISEELDLGINIKIN